MNESLFIVVRQSFGDPNAQTPAKANLGLFRDGSGLIWNSEGSQTLSFPTRPTDRKLPNQDRVEDPEVVQEGLRLWQNLLVLNQTVLLSVKLHELKNTEELRHWARILASSLWTHNCRWDRTHAQISLLEKIRKEAQLSRQKINLLGVAIQIYGDHLSSQSREYCQTESDSERLRLRLSVPHLAINKTRSGFIAIADGQVWQTIIGMPSVMLLPLKQASEDDLDDRRSLTKEELKSWIISFMSAYNGSRLQFD